ncbi:MAG: hypothetical protein ACYDH6_00420 [Acidimicrobiales bacterium]
MSSPTPTRPGGQPASRSWIVDERAAVVFRVAAAFYAIAWVIHSGDHLRRGFDVVTTQVTVLGSAGAVLQIAAIAAVFLRRRWAPVAAIAIGFPDALGIAGVHLLPHWSAFSDAFPGAHGTGVTGFSWFAAIVEVGGAFAFGLAGLYAWRRIGTMAS